MLFEILDLTYLEELTVTFGKNRAVNESHILFVSLLYINV